jgi:hypothetical protein
VSDGVYMGVVFVLWVMLMDAVFCMLYVWFFDQIGRVFVVVVFVFIFIVDISFHLFRPPGRGDFVRLTVYGGWIGLAR